jgi:hypothetical protein
MSQITSSNFPACIEQAGRVLEWILELESFLMRDLSH